MLGFVNECLKLLMANRGDLLHKILAFAFRQMILLADGKDHCTIFPVKFIPGFLFSVFQTPEMGRPGCKSSMSAVSFSRVQSSVCKKLFSAIVSLNSGII